jgi:hypothetical protein
MANATDQRILANYKSAIEDYVTLDVRAKHPEYGELHFGFSEPIRVLVGLKRQPRIAVECSWSPDLKNGDHLLLMVRETFLVDTGFLCQVSVSEQVEWIDGYPKMDKGQPNQSSEPTSSSGEPPAGHDPRLP